MPDPIDFPRPPMAAREANEGRDGGKRDASVGVPSNAVYARVGDVVLRAAQEGVRRGDRTEDIIRAIVAEHHVHLTRGELRLLLASRRIAE